MKKIIILTLIFLGCYNIYAQETMASSNRDHLFEDGRNLYTQQKYGMAKKILEQYLSSTDEVSPLYVEAKYYIVCSSYALNDPNTEEILSDFIEQYPYHSMKNRVEFLLGKTYFEQQNYKQANIYLDNISPAELDDKEREEYYFAHGYSLLQKKEYENAKMSFLRLGHSNKYYNDKNYYVAYCDYSCGHYDSAIPGLELCKNTPFEEEAMYLLLQIYEQQSNVDLAVKTGQELIKKYPQNPNNTEAFRILGQSSYRKGNYNDAIKYLVEYEKKSHKVQREVMYMLGISLYKNARYNDAIKYLSKVTTKKDEMAESAYFTIGQSALQTDDPQKAKMSFYSAYNIGLDRKLKEEALYNYAIATYHTGSVFGESTRAFNRFINEYPTSEHSDEIFDLLTAVYISESNYEAALKSINTIKNSNKKIEQAKEYILFRIGTKHFNNKDYTKAEDYLSQSIRLNNDKSITHQAFLVRGETFFTKKEYSKAINDLKKYINKNKKELQNTAKAYYTIGYSYFSTQNWEKAIENFDIYLKKEPQKSSEHYFDAQCRIGDAYFYKRNFATASTNYEKVIVSNSSSTDYAMYQNAFIKVLKKKYNTAIKDFKQLITKYPTSVYAPKSQYQIGRSFVLQNQYEQAIEEYKNVLKKYPQTPIAQQVSLEIGMLYENMGDYTNAIEAYKKVVSQYPGSEQTNVALESMQNIYVEQNNVKGYIEYTKTINGNTAVGLSVSKEDSLSYIAAEKAYAKKDYKGSSTAFAEYLNSYCQKLNTQNCINATYYLADSYNQLNDTSNALSLYDRLTTLNGNKYQEESLMKAADITYSKQQFEQAAKYFTALKDITTNGDIKFKSKLGALRCYYQNKDYALAIDYSSILLLNTLDKETEKEAIYYRLKSLIALDDWGEAVKDIDSLKNDVSTYIGAECAFLKATYFYNQKEYKKSENEILDFIGKKSPHQYWTARSFVLLSDNYFTQKDYYQAKQYLITLRENYKAKNEIEQMINTRLDAIDKIYTEEVY